MKTIFTVILVFFCMFSYSLSQTSSDVKAPSAVAYVDPINFSGLWYEIARTYNSFEDGCVAATVEYRLFEPLKYEVLNRCFKGDIGEQLVTYEGTATPLRGNSMSQIEKTYFWIFSKDYRVIYLDNYKTAVMVDEEMENVWIMNREPFLNEEALDSIVYMLSKYMDTSKLIYTPQDKNGRYK